MERRWFNVPERGAGTQADPYQPDLGGLTVERVEGNRIGAAPRYVVRVTAAVDTLDDVEAQAGVATLSVSEARSSLDAGSAATLDDKSRLLTND